MCEHKVSTSLYEWEVTVLVFVGSACSDPQLSFTASSYDVAWLEAPPRAACQRLLGREVFLSTKNDAFNAAFVFGERPVPDEAQRPSTQARSGIYDRRDGWWGRYPPKNI